MTNKDDQNDEVFSSAQQSALKQAFQKLNNQLGVDAFNVEKQAQILRGRLDQIPSPKPRLSVFHNLVLKMRKGFSGPWFTAAIASFGIGLAVSRIFLIAEPLQVASINLNVNSEKSIQSVSSNNSNNDVMEAAQTVSNKLAVQPLEINIQAPDLEKERNKLISAALKAGLSIQISGDIDGFKVRADGLSANKLDQKTFKTLYKISEDQEGSIIFILKKQ